MPQPGPRFCWDDGNRWKVEERFDIEDVEEIFDDPDRIPAPASNVLGERRWAFIAATADDRVLFVVYTWREDRIRVISARPANTREQRSYWNRRAKPR
jgi:uncharacterized protein